MRQWMATHRVSRASVAVTHDGRLAFASGYGGRAAHERVPVWSLSKAITALCIASLIREKRLGLSDPIGPLLAPVFSKYGDPADERVTRITVAQLLTHRSGLPRTIDGENLFAPGLTELLRHRAPCDARIEMLLPEIVKVGLVRDVDTEFEYTNIGYVLLGQIIEVLTGRSYEAACAERVLAMAGVGNRPSLDRNWGGIMQSAGGWALSGPEYLAFARLLDARGSALVSPDVADFLRSPEGKWIDANQQFAYSLGVVVEPVPGRAPNFFHQGGHNWNQSDAAGGPIDEDRGASFALTGDGVGWFASYDGLNAGTNPDATVALLRAFLRAKDRVSSWPEQDQFTAIGIQPLAHEEG
jgi:CubicO group peptidase (beta-lactamase class C family)